METISLGSSLKMPKLGLGTWKLEGKECKSAVETALNLGYRHIDTAAAYGNHQEVGQGIKNADIDRKDIFITSKIWRDNLSYPEIISAGKQILSELKLDYLDLLLVHWPNKEVPLSETIKGLKELKEAGLTKEVGVSNFTINHLEDVFAIEENLLAVNQFEIHPYFYQDRLIDYCQENEIAVTAYSPLARGRIFTDETINKLASKYDRSPAQLVLRWLIEQDIVTIPKASSVDHLKDNLKALKGGFPPEVEKELDQLNEEERIINPDFAEFNY